MTLDRNAEAFQAEQRKARDPRALLDGFWKMCSVCRPDDATRASAAAVSSGKSAASAQRSSASG